MRVAQAAPASPPSWCKGVRESSSDQQLEYALDPAADPQNALPAIAQALCFPDDKSRSKRPAIEASRQTWMKRLLLAEADWATDGLAWSALPYADRAQTSLRGSDPQDSVAWSKMSPIEQWLALRTKQGPSAAFRLQPGAEYYLADALPLTETGRLGFLERCLFPSGFGDEVHPVAWAACQHDLDALDPGKLTAELRGESSRSLVDRMNVRFAYDAVQRHLPKHAARVKALTAKDPAYAQLFELAAAARKDWSDRAAARADALAAVLAMDDARATRSRKAMAGCSERAWPLFAAAVGKLPAKRFENLRADAERGGNFLQAAVGAVLQDPDAYLAANALVACEGAADHLLVQLQAGLSTWSGFRGPRTAALTAIRLAALTPDERGATIDVPMVSLPLAIERVSPAGDGVGVTAVIATVTDQGDTVRVTFPQTSELQDQCTNRRATSRISRIDSSGNVIYESVCTEWKRVRVDTTPTPVSIAKRYAGGLKPKLFVSILSGVPEAIWPKASSPTPLAAFGVPLK